MSLVESIKAILRDPPPEFAFEISADGIAMSRTRPPAEVVEQPLDPGILAPSPVKDNVVDAASFAHAVAKLVPPAARKGRRTAALILPDNAVRIAVVDFDALPAKEEERLALIRFRLRKTLPFDLDEAALSYHVQAGNKVVAVVAPLEIVARYEAPFRAVGLHPGLVLPSSIALLELLPTSGSLLVAHVTFGALTVLALKDGVLTLARSLELAPDTADPLEEISTDLYPTLVYLEDQTGARPDRLLIVGFGDQAEAAAVRLSVELELPVDSLPAPHPGLAGYLASLAPSPRKAAA